MAQLKATLKPILMADDDKDDRLLTGKALEQNKIANPFVTVADGEELMDYLKRKGKYSDPATSPRPCFILLDLNMPRMDGRKALLFVKADPELKKYRWWCSAPPAPRRISCAVTTWGPIPSSPSRQLRRTGGHGGIPQELLAGNRRIAPGEWTLIPNDIKADPPAGR